MASDYKLKQFACYEVNHYLPAPISVTVDFNDEIAKSYLTEVISGIFDSRKNRKYEFKSKNQEVCRLICEDRDTSFDMVSESLANRLHRSQIERQKEIKKLNKEISTGHFFIINFTQDDNEFILLSKHNPEGILDLNTLKIIKGLPDDRKSYKGCLISLESMQDKPDTVSQVLVRDTSQVVADYWFNLFLELNPVRLDKDNISACFKAVDSALAKFKRKYPTDTKHIRNHLVSNLKRDGNTFDYNDDFIQYVKELHTQHPKFPKEELIQTLEELPTHSKKGFDLNFTRIPSEIKARKVGDFVPLNEYFDLHIKDKDLNPKGSVDGLFGNTIYSDKIKGTKCVVIKSDKGYEAFRTK